MGDIIADRWPKFEDGRYVSIGDWTYATNYSFRIDVFKIARIEFFDDCVKMHDADNKFCSLVKQGYAVKEFIAKDKDGTRVNIGDTVYEFDDQNSYKVIDFLTDPSGSVMVRTKDQNNTLIDLYINNVSHKKPYMWSDIKDAINKVTQETYCVCDYFNTLYNNDSDCDKCPAKDHNCEFSMAEDVFKHCKELAGVDDDN